MTKNTLSEKFSTVVTRRSVFCVVGFFCFLYALLSSDFAELHIKFSQLSFPIFVGEILLFACLAVLGVQTLRTRARPDTKIPLVFILYILWVFIKAYTGYRSGGPLALRNAALFYYPCFALVGYLVFDIGFFNVISKFLLVGTLFVSLFFVRPYDYFAVSFLILALGLCLQLRPVLLRIAGILLSVFYVIYSRILWWDCRSHMVGIAVMSVFLAVYSLFGLLKARRVIKLWSLLLLGVIFSMLLFKFGDKNALKSMMTFRELQKKYIALDNQITEGKKTFVQWSLPVHLYNENEGTKQIEDMIARNPKAPQPSPVSQDTPAPEPAQVENPAPLPGDTPEQNKGFVTRSAASVTAVPGGSGTVKPAGYEKSAAVKNAEKKPAVAPADRKSKDRSLEIAYSNIFFRIFVWRDMVDDIVKQKAWWGVSFGQPQRSISLEILNWAPTEWQRDGWITPHNSFLHMIYRGGLVGFACVIALFSLLINMMKRFYKMRSVWGGLLMACLVYWVTIANFLVFLELPYTAIPFWTFLGITLSYLHLLEKQRAV